MNLCTWYSRTLTFVDSKTEGVYLSISFLDVNSIVEYGSWSSRRSVPHHSDKSFGYMHSQSGTRYSVTDKYGFWHPGYAWACSRAAWKKMGGLIDWAILGSADRHMALAWIGKCQLSYPGNIHENYKRLIEDFQHECDGFKIGNINGTIIHEWHGSLENRKYKERWSILTDNKFDPLVDIGLTEEGTLRLTPQGQRLEKELKKYFLERKEDSV